jgi:hypothetical protein
LAKITQVVNIALLCSQVKAEKRPSMSHVVGMLKGEMAIEVLPMEKPRLDELNRSFEVLQMFQKTSRTRIINHGVKESQAMINRQVQQTQMLLEVNKLEVSTLSFMF